MKKYNLIPLLAVVGVLGLAGCGKINPSTGGSGAHIYGSTVSEICDAAAANYYNVSEVSSSISEFADGRPLDATDNYAKAESSYSSAYYLGNVASASTEISTIEGVSSELEVKEKSSTNVLLWADSPLDATLTDQKEIFLSTSSEYKGVSSVDYQSLGYVASATIDDEMKYGRVNFADMFMNGIKPSDFRRDSEFTYLKISDKLVKGSMSSVIGMTTVANPKYPSDATKALTKITVARAVTVYEKTDAFGWVLTSMWSENVEKIVTDFELEPISDPMILGQSEGKITFKYAAQADLPAYTGEKTYVEDSGEKAMLYPYLTAFDKTTEAFAGLGTGSTSFTDITDAWNSIYGVSNKAVYRTLSPVGINSSYHWSFTNVEQATAETPVYEAFGLESISITSGVSNLLVGVEGHKMFRTADSISTQVAFYITVVYPENSNVPSINLSIMPGQTI